MTTLGEPKQYETHVCTHEDRGHNHDCHCGFGHDHTWDEFKNYQDSEEAYYR